MLPRLSITIGLRNYRVIPSDRADSIDCDCARAEIVCPVDTTLRELGEVVTSAEAHERPSLRRVPLLSGGVD